MNEKEDLRMKEWQQREFSKLREYHGELIQTVPQSVQKSRRDPSHLSCWETIPYVKVVH